MKASFKTSLILLIITCLGINRSYCGENMKLTAGAGLPELICAGLRHQIAQSQIGLSIGSVPLSDETIFSVCGDYLYHFTGESEHSELFTWFGRAGLNFMYDETDNILAKYLYLNLRVGKDIYFSNNIGLTIDGGLIIELTKDERLKKSGNWDFNFDFPVLPSLAAVLFFKL